MSIEQIFGNAEPLNTLQMSCRAVMVFFMVLVAVRCAGRRSFGQRTPFDQVVAILLGAIASRIVVGASGVMPTMAACFVIVLLHRLLALASVWSPRIDALINGTERAVLINGRTDEEQMRKALITRRDLLECARDHGQTGLQNARQIILERSGELSLLKGSSKA